MERKDAVKLQNELRAALEKFAQERGLSINLGSGRYGINDFRTTVTFVQASEDGEQSGAEVEFRKYTNMFGVSPDAFGKSFIQGRTKYTISGIKPRSRKFPILATTDKGQIFKFPVASINRFLK